MLLARRAAGLAAPAACAAPVGCAGAQLLQRAAASTATSDTGGEGLTGSHYGISGSGGFSISNIPVHLDATIPVDLPVTGGIGLIQVTPITVSPIQFDLHNVAGGFEVTGPLGGFTVPAITNTIPVNLTIGSPTTNVSITATGSLGHINTGYSYAIPVTGTLGPGLGQLPINFTIPEDILVRVKVGAVWTKLATLNNSLNFNVNTTFPTIPIDRILTPRG